MLEQNIACLPERRLNRLGAPWSIVDVGREVIGLLAQLNGFLLVRG
jgi:hypothetical protein